MAIARAHQLFPVPIAAEVLIEDAATMQEVALSDTGPGRLSLVGCIFSRSFLVS